VRKLGLSADPKLVDAILYLLLDEFHNEDLLDSRIFADWMASTRLKRANFDGFLQQQASQPQLKKSVLLSIHNGINTSGVKPAADSVDFSTVTAAMRDFVNDFESGSSSEFRTLQVYSLLLSAAGVMRLAFMTRSPTSAVISFCDSVPTSQTDPAIGLLSSSKNHWEAVTKIDLRHCTVADDRYERLVKSVGAMWRACLSTRNPASNPASEKAPIKDATAHSAATAANDNTVPVNAKTKPSTLRKRKARARRKARLTLEKVQQAEDAKATQQTLLEWIDRAAASDSSMRGNLRAKVLQSITRGESPASVRSALRRGECVFGAHCHTQRSGGRCSHQLVQIDPLAADPSVMIKAAAASRQAKPGSAVATRKTKSAKAVSSGESRVGKQQSSATTAEKSKSKSRTDASTTASSASAVGSPATASGTRVSDASDSSSPEQSLKECVQDLASIVRLVLSQPSSAAQQISQPSANVQSVVQPLQAQLANVPAASPGFLPESVNLRQLQFFLRLFQEFGQASARF
jgi:hypothetical protein